MFVLVYGAVVQYVFMIVNGAGWQGRSMEQKVKTCSFGLQVSQESDTWLILMYLFDHPPDT